jgi:hypothetical protein
MKKIAIATSILAVILGLGVSQNGCGATKIKTVSPATIATLPPGKTFEIDLTRKGTVYDFNMPGTDFSRVTIRTPEGVKNFADLLKGANTSLRGGVVLGTPDDMRDHLPTTTRGTHYDCGVFCKCDDTIDCLNMILDGKCSDVIWCSKSTDSCFCVAKA